MKRVTILLALFFIHLFFHTFIWLANTWLTDPVQYKNRIRAPESFTDAAFRMVSRTAVVRIITTSAYPPG